MKLSKLTITKKECNVNTPEYRVFETIEWYRDCNEYFKGFEDDELASKVTSIVENSDILVFGHEDCVYAMNLNNLDLYTAHDGVLKKMVFDYEDLNRRTTRVKSLYCVIEEVYSYKTSSIILFGI